MMMKKPITFVLATALMAVGSMAAPDPAEAVVRAQDGKTKINLSGRQRMLSQRMAKAACFAFAGVRTDDHLVKLGQARGLFDTTLTGLAKGDDAQGMQPETDAEIIANLDEVATLWTAYDSAVTSIIDAGAITDDQMLTIAQTNGPVLKKMHQTVGVIEKVYGSSGDVHPALALALNVSGRQRMLTQKASKEFCLVVAGIDADANRAALKDTAALFTTSLQGLINGDRAQALAPAPTPAIKAQLEKVQTMWTPLQQIFNATANGVAPTADDIDKVATDNNPLLSEMNKAVFMYNDL